jgi:hypothetical protein
MIRASAGSRWGWWRSWARSRLRAPPPRPGALVRRRPGRAPTGQPGVGSSRRAPQRSRQRSAADLDCPRRPLTHHGARPPDGRYARSDGGIQPLSLPSSREGKGPVTPEALAADPDASARVAAGWADLRRPPSDVIVDEVIGRVEAALRVRLDRGALLRKRRTVSARSDRGTWVRIEARPVDRVIRQGWAGQAGLVSGRVLERLERGCVVARGRDRAGHGGAEPRLQRSASMRRESFGQQLSGGVHVQ